MLRAGLVATALSVTPLSAQTPATRADSLADSLALLADRVARAEDAVALIKQQLATLAQSGASTKARRPIEFSGRVLFNAFRTTGDGRSNSIDGPTSVRGAFVPAAGTPASQRSTLGATFRQTTLAVAVRGGSLLGGQASAFAEADFFGGVQTGSGGRQVFPVPRLRIAQLALKWSQGEVMVGQDVPLVSNIEPASLGAIGVPLFASAGNLWFWLPQVRATIESDGPIRLALQGAVLAPWSGEFAAGDPDEVDLGERAGRPTLQAKVRARWGEEETAGELGVGVHQGWFGLPSGVVVESRAVVISARIPVTSFVDLRGEVYQGQGLRGLGGGGVSQNFGAVVAPATVGPVLKDGGGWAQLNLHPTTRLMVGGGCGYSDPDDTQGPIRRKNEVCEGHLQWRPNGLPVVGLEYRGITTTFASGPVRLTHLNLAFGMEF